jgi:hypothetical protein
MQQDNVIIYGRLKKKLVFHGSAFTPVSGALSIDSPTPTSTPNLKKHPFMYSVKNQFFFKNLI